MRRIIDDPMVPLRALLHEANDSIARAVATLYGACSAEAIVSREPVLAPLLTDPRAMRLVLPATVMTLARVNRRAATVEWAHLGDTALITLSDPYAMMTYSPRLGPLETDPTYQVLCNASIDPTLIPPSLATVLAKSLYSEIASRLYHNYVTADGRPDTTVGIGVIDGLPVMDAFVREGQISMDRCSGILLCSDGFLLPPDALKHWGDISQHSYYIDVMMRELTPSSMGDYLVALRQEVADRPQRNPITVHDDATGVRIRW
jgi:hypothetical protein